MSAIPDRALPALHGLLDAPYHAACPFSAAIPSLEDARRCEDLLRPIAMELAGTGPQLTGWAAGGHKCISPVLLCFLILSKFVAFFGVFFCVAFFCPPPQGKPQLWYCLVAGKSGACGRGCRAPRPAERSRGEPLPSADRVQGVLLSLMCGAAGAGLPVIGTRLWGLNLRS